MRSEPNRRIRSSSSDRKNCDAPGSPWRPERPRNCRSMRRDSCRSEPMMCRPPISMTLISFPSGSLTFDGFGSRHAGAEFDVGSAAGHVRRDRDRARLTGARHDLRLALVVLRVEHVVLQSGAAEHLGQRLRRLDARRADRAPGSRGRAAGASPRRSRCTSRAASCRRGRGGPRGPSAGSSG